MTPYADFLYFGILLYPALPTLLLGLLGLFVRGTLARAWILLVTAAMLAVQYGGSVNLPNAWALPALALVAAWAVYQWALAAVFLLVRRRTSRRWPGYLAIALGLAPLAATKLLPLASPDWLIGFLGISYVTFRALDVLFLIQDRLLLALHPGEYLAFLLFFPAISSGPIDRYRRWSVDWKGHRPRAEFLQDLDAAVHRVFTGFLFKFILAALVQRYWLDRAAAGTGLLDELSYMYAYSFYLFFDFAGYSHFAIGASYLFGVHTPENFQRPFLATNIRDFWNRWHITLSWWLRDHVYMRFVLAATRGRWFSSKYLASYLGFFLSMGLMGLWHGTQLHYLLYGLYHGALLSGHDLLSRWNRAHRLWGDGPLWRVASIVVTFHVVAVGFLLFSGHLF